MGMQLFWWSGKREGGGRPPQAKIAFDEETPEGMAHQEIECAKKSTQTCSKVYPLKWCNDCNKPLYINRRYFQCPWEETGCLGCRPWCWLAKKETVPQPWRKKRKYGR